MVSDGQPPVKRLKAEMVEVNLDENTLAAEEVVVKEEVKEMEMEGMEVSKHLRKALEARVVLIHRSVKTWKEKKMVEERESAYLLKNLLLEQKRKERELEDTVLRQKQELDQEKSNNEELKNTLKEMAANAGEMHNSMKGEIEDKKRDSIEKDSLIGDLKNEMVKQENTAKDTIQALKNDLAHKDTIVERQKGKLVGMQNLLKDYSAAKDSIIDDLNKRLGEADSLLKTAKENVTDKDITIR